MGGDHLIEKAHKMDGAWGWVVSQGKAPLCGFSHGSAGISYALFKLAKATDDLKYKHAAEMGIRYERKHYCPDTKNWLDLRESSSNNKETYAWCHGAPGIGFSRLIASKLYPNTELRQEAAIGLESTEKHLMSLHHHLCCGNFGKISILWDSGKILKKKRLREAALKSAAFLLNQEKDLGEHPGFMKGLSGIGYSLLRMTAAGKSLPQVMILE
jgi:lantibiotic modifying enzyme